jgi:hypothetical protein
MSFFLFYCLSCSEPQTTPSPSEPSSIEVHTSNDDQTHPLVHQENQNLDHGQKHPPIPSDNPIWEWDAKGFVPDFGWYGEHSWADVRMRVMGHIATAGRDHARMAAQDNNLEEAALRYLRLTELLGAIPIPSSGHAHDLAIELKRAAERDYQITMSLSNGVAPEANETTGLDNLRIRYYAVALDPSPEKAQALQDELMPYLVTDPSLNISGFSDFTERHTLRVRLFEAYSEALDPIGLSERWGYWTDTERIRQALCIGWALGKLGGNDWEEKLSEFQKTPLSEPEFNQHNAIYWPSLMAETLTSEDMQPTFDFEEFAWLPTGDSLIDVTGQPGPKAIGELMILGVNDQEYQHWLTPHLMTMKTSADNNQPLIIEVKRLVDALNEQYNHGSLFYNLKQIRNASVRQLARKGHFEEAYAAHQLNFPLHHQDWACPNRDGLLKALGGRLLAEANHKDADAELLSSIESSLTFLEKVTLAEKGQINGPKPPRLNVPRQGHNPNQRPPSPKH